MFFLTAGKKSLREIFQLYFRMKDRIFSKPRIGFGFNTDVLEEILQECLDLDVKMTDVTHPKYVPLISGQVFAAKYHRSGKFRVTKLLYDKLLSK
jgi:hypothetical protein